MSRRLRSRLLSESNTEDGAIVSEMKSYTLKPIPNDGIHVYGNTRINPDVSAPFSSSQEITIRLTSPNFDVCEFANSYIHMTLRLRLRFNNAPVVNGTDSFAEMLKKNQFVFLGLKCSNQIIRNYSFKHNDVPITTTLQSNAVYESYLFSALMSKSERANKKYIFSPYEEVCQLDNSSCGIFLPVGDLIDGTYVNLDLIIPYRAMLAMSGWNEFCNRIFGELKMVFSLTSEAFVHTEVNPITSIRKGIISGKISRDIPHLSDVLAVDSDSLIYKHCFEQVAVGTPIQFISGYDEEAHKLTFSTSADFAPYIDEVVATEVWADVRGYRASEQAINELRSYWEHEPFVVCAQKVDTFTFPSNATPSGIRTAMNVRFNKATDAVVLFPKDSRHRTIFTNICYDKLQLQIGNQRFPDSLVATNSAQWFAQQLQSSDFDSIFEASEAWEHSITDVLTDGERMLNPVTDNTDFVPIFQFERSGGADAPGSTWFDGIDGPYKVELTGNPVHPSHDVYYVNGSMPSPILCNDSESYWVFRLIGGMPNVQYVVGHTFEEAYGNPDIERV